MSSKRWKREELAVAADIGGVRVPVTGRQRGDAPDVAHDLYSIEVKSRKSFPQWIEEALQQAEASMVNRNQVPIAFFIHNRGRGFKKRKYAMMRYETFFDWNAHKGMWLPEELTEE